MNFIKFLNRIDKICVGCGVVFFILMTGITFIQVIARYFVGHTLTWPEEACRFSFIWMAYMGMSSCMCHDSHLKVDILTSKLRGKTQTAFYIIDMFLSVCFFVFVCYHGIDMLNLVRESEQVALTLPVSLVYVWAAIPIAFGLAAVYSVGHIVRAFLGITSKEGSVVL